MALSDLFNVIQQYSGVSASNPPANTHEDFSKVAQTAPIAPGWGIGGGISLGSNVAFSRNGRELIQSVQRRAARRYPDSAGQLLGGKPVIRARGTVQRIAETGITSYPQQAEQIPPEAVQQLAEHAQKNNPSIVDQASSFYAQHPQLVQGLGAGALALIMSHMSKRS
jgi:hypothetical protein